MNNLNNQEVVKLSAQISECETHLNIAKNKIKEFINEVNKILSDLTNQGMEETAEKINTKVQQRVSKAEEEIKTNQIMLDKYKERLKNLQCAPNNTQLNS